ncbi:MAG: hypothetical protein IJV68_00190 [Clostridia bacterium]|nr:hypothetical protein [Clostridia bacterium]
MIGELPKSLDVNGTQFAIRTDFRDILKIVCAFNDPELENEEKVYVCMYILYEDFDCIPKADYEAAFQAALDFIDYNVKGENKKSPRTMDWEQDENIMFPALNKVAGFETRTSKYLHWWTFMGYFMEISEGVFSHVLNMRSKKARNKPLEKWEREYWNANKAICVLKPKLTAEEQEAKDRLNAMLG